MSKYASIFVILCCVLCPCYAKDKGKIIRKSLVKTVSLSTNTVRIYKILYRSDGLRVSGYLSLPDYSREKLPVVVFNRGGVHEHFQVDTQLMVFLSGLFHHRYIIAASQYRGNDGGDSYNKVANGGNYGGNEVADILNLMEAVKSLPQADPDRIAFFGFSRGTVDTFVALRRGADVRAACVLGSITHLPEIFNDVRPYSRELIQGLIGSTPEEDPLAYMERSVYFWPGLIHTPLLILHGDNDRSVHPRYAQYLDQALNDTQIPHRLVILSNQGHWPDEEGWEIAGEEIRNWFEKYLSEEAK